MDNKKSGNALYTINSTSDNPGGNYNGISPVLYFDASLSNTIYGKSTTVQPSAYVVAYWQRTA